MRLRRSRLLPSVAPIVPVLDFALVAAGLVLHQQNEDLLSDAKARNGATMAAIDAELRLAAGVTDNVVVRNFNLKDQVGQQACAHT